MIVASSCTNNFWNKKQQKYTAGDKNRTLIYGVCISCMKLSLSMKMFLVVGLDKICNKSMQKIFLSVNVMLLRQHLCLKTSKLFNTSNIAFERPEHFKAKQLRNREELVTNYFPDVEGCVIALFQTVLWLKCNK